MPEPSGAIPDLDAAPAHLRRDSVAHDIRRYLQQRVRGMMAAADVLRGGGSLGDAKRAAREARERDKGPIDEWLFRDGRWKCIQGGQAKVDGISCRAGRPGMCAHPDAHVRTQVRTCEHIENRAARCLVPHRGSNYSRRRGRERT
jgi:hypothetical protein